jgi:hypothetical protein
MMRSALILSGWMLAWSGLVHAESYSQEAYRSCLLQADQSYRECLRESDQDRGCRQRKRQDNDQCQSAFTQAGSQDPYYGQPNGIAPRFEPVPIPQRPAYISPGMR